MSNGLLECLAFDGNSVRTSELDMVTKTGEDGTQHHENALVAIVSSSPKMVALDLGGGGLDVSTGKIFDKNTRVILALSRHSFFDARLL